MPCILSFSHTVSHLATCVQRAHQKLRQVPVVREKSHSPSPPIRVAIASDVNFQYLKHVVIRFMCSHTDEALQLTKAIATLLEFSPQEEQHVKNYLNYKVRKTWH